MGMKIKPFIAHSELTNEIYIVAGNEKYRVTEQAVKAVKAIKALEQEPRWIPVSERLPEENKTVIASTGYEVCPETRYTKEDGWEWAYESGAGYWEKLAGVKAWMPLPELYKAESEDKE